MRGLTSAEARTVRSAIAAVDGDAREDVSPLELTAVEVCVTAGWLRAVNTSAPWCNCGLPHTAIVPTAEGREALRTYDLPASSGLQ